VLLAPAMNTNMLEHTAVRANLDVLAARGVRFVEPGEGFLACGWIGKGRLAEPDEIVAAAEALLQARPEGSLLGRRIVVSAGPTYEDLDPVRFIGNRSSGRMGYAVAAEAARRGAHVVLVSGPTRLDPPAGVEIERVRSATEMARAMTTKAAGADAVVMAAAVADYTPERGAATGKMAKQGSALHVTLVPTVDILAELGRARGSAPLPVLVGFAAETGDPRPRARQKLAAKQLDLIVANDVSQPGAGFESDTNEVRIMSPSRSTQLVDQRDKRAVARAVLDAVVADRATP
jgi:phosphopantothenoylcysteine decarboxylase/phosphopantothenate--cysteine ligase